MKRLELLLQLAETESDAAVRVVADRRAALAKASDRLEELTRYREEYSRHLGSAQAGGFGVQMREHRRFLDRLNTAVDQQRRDLQRIRGGVEAALAAWMDARKRLSTLGNAANRFKALDRKEAVRREQRLSDEFSARYSKRNAD